MSLRKNIPLHKYLANLDQFDEIFDYIQGLILGILGEGVEPSLGVVPGCGG